MLQCINKCSTEDVEAQCLNSNSLFWSLHKHLEHLSHLKANYEKCTQAIYFLFDPTGLGEQAEALKPADHECSIIMTVFYKTVVTYSFRACKHFNIHVCV